MGAGRPRSINNTKVFDVAKPGKARPISTSRPVISGHDSPIKDSTVINVSDENLNSKPLDPPSITRKQLQPIEETENAEVPTSESASNLSSPESSTQTPVSTAPLFNANEASKRPIDAEIAAVDISEETLPKGEVGTEQPEETDELIDESSKAEEPEVADGKVGDKDKASKKAEEEKTSEQPVATEASETATVDALAEASEKPKQDQQKAEEEAKKVAALQELIDSKKYVVPLAHDSTRQTSGRWFWVVLTAIIILLSGAYLLIDAKIIKTSFNLPYHLFKQTEQAVSNNSDTSATPLVLSLSGLKISYDHSLWTLEAPTNTDAGSSATIILDNKTKNIVSISAYELKKTSSDTSASDTSSTAVTTFQDATKISSGGDSELYLSTYIRNYTLKNKGTFYQPEIRLTSDALGQSKLIPIKDKEYTLSLFGSVISAADGTPARFTTLEEAKNWFKTSEDYAKIKTVFMSIKY